MGNLNKVKEWFELMIYLDNAATTKPIPFETEIWGNPSSPNIIGIRAERAISEARERIAKFLDVKPQEIFFTSGGTESNNIAILGLKCNHIFTEPWEHPSIIEPIRAMCNANIVIAPKEKWLANISDYQNCLICLSHVNHETGDINDISALAKEIKEKNSQATIHVDGAQGMCKEKTDLENIDMYSFSGHKFHGANGVGGLFVKNGIRLSPTIFGGGQEKKLRSGTENLRGILHMDSAITIYPDLQSIRPHIESLYDCLASLTNDLPNTFINSLTNNTSPYIINISFLGIKGETLVHLLSERGVYASMGAACNSRKKEKSSLELMGFPPERVSSAVRFSFSYDNTLDEIVKTKSIIIECVEMLRKVFR